MARGPNSPMATAWVGAGVTLGSVRLASSSTFLNSGECCRDGGNSRYCPATGNYALLNYRQVRSVSDTKISIREARASDATAIAALLGELEHPTESRDVAPRLAAVRADHGDVFLAVDEQDQPLGLVSLSRHVAIHAPGPIAYITALVTSSTARRRGVGQLLVAAAKRWALEQGCVRLSVTSAERRADAHAFYPRCGLPYTGRRFSTQIFADD